MEHVACQGDDDVRLTEADLVCVWDGRGERKSRRGHRAAGGRLGRALGRHRCEQHPCHKMRLSLTVILLSAKMLVCHSVLAH